MKKFTDILKESNNDEFNNFLNEEFKIPIINKDVKETATEIKDYIYEHLKIAKDKISDPENVKKVNSFLDSVEEVSTKITDTIKKERNLKILSNVIDFAKWGSIIAGVYGLVFNSSISFVSGIEVGGIGAFKLALFLYIMKLIISVFRGIVVFSDLVKNIKSFVSNIINILKQKKTDDSVSEKYINCLNEFELI